MSKKRLIDLLKVQSKSYQTERMTAFITAALDELGIPYELVGQAIYATKGNAPTYPCMVAHTDTVHSIVDGEIHIHEQRGMLFAMTDQLDRIGTGGDDKCGIYVTLELLRSQEVMKAAFFPDEEVGCVGSAAADMDFFDDCEFVLQCDRRGADDFTESIMGIALISEEFRTAVEPVMQSHGRSFVSGGMTDVWRLRKNGMNICSANMSCNYYEPHAKTEHIHFTGLKKTLKFCNDLFAMLKGHVWVMPELPPPPVYTRRPYSSIYIAPEVTTPNANDWEHPADCTCKVPQAVDYGHGYSFCETCWGEIKKPSK